MSRSFGECGHMVIDVCFRMPVADCIRVWIYLGIVVGLTKTSRPRFDTSTDMRKVLVPADAEVDSAIFRLRATDEEPDFPLIFNITVATIIPVVRIENLPCTLYNKVCQANVILTRRLSPGKYYDFLVTVRDSKGECNSMQATISVTNGTTPLNKIFLHKPSLIMVPEDAKPGTELDYLIVQSNPWSNKPVYIELWQPKDLFKIAQRQTKRQTEGIITLIGELDFETQTMHTLAMYATDPYTEPAYDTRNMVGLQVVVVVQDVQDVPPIFTFAPPLTKINNTIQPGDVIVRVHAEDGDKGVPREVTYGLVSEGNPFTPFFSINETSGEIHLARPLDQLTLITRVGAPVILSVVAEEVRHSWDDPPAQATVVELGIVLGEPENSPPYFESDKYVAWIDENSEPGTTLQFPESYLTSVKDDDAGKAGVFALKLLNNNGTFEINPTVAERAANFVIMVRDNSLLDYEKHKSLLFQIVAQEVGPATNLSTTAAAIIFLRDVNDNPPEFDKNKYEISLSENATVGTRVVQVHATDKDSGLFGIVRYTKIKGMGSEAFYIDPVSGLITVMMNNNNVLDRERGEKLEITVEARDENGKGLRTDVPILIHLLDVNDNTPIFERASYQFTVSSETNNFTAPAIVKATDADSEPPNNEIRYEIIHGNYDNKFSLNDVTGELFLREDIHKSRRVRQNTKPKLPHKLEKEFQDVPKEFFNNSGHVISVEPALNKSSEDNETEKIGMHVRTKRVEENVLFTLTVRAYDLGVPIMSSNAEVKILRGATSGTRIVTFVMPGEHPDPRKTAQTLATITGGRVTIQEIRPYVPRSPSQSDDSDGGKKSVIVARVEQSGFETLVDIEKIRQSLAANGVGVISGMDGMQTHSENSSSSPDTGVVRTHITNITNIRNEEATIYKTENKFLVWLLIILAILILLAIAATILCCICPGCPFYMEPRKRRIHSSETLIIHADGKPKRHVQRRHHKVMNGFSSDRKQAWSADNKKQTRHFDRRTKNQGLSSLPGDITNMQSASLTRNIEARYQEDPNYLYKRREEEVQGNDEIEAMRHRVEEKVFVESMEGHTGARPYRQMGQSRAEDFNEAEKYVREHYFRDGNAEILRLFTRGEEDQTPSHRHQDMNRESDVKDILLQRFIEDQKMRRTQQELLGSAREAADHTMESHMRVHNENLGPLQPPEIILVPETLNARHFNYLREDIQQLLNEHKQDQARFRQAHDPKITTIKITRAEDNIDDTAEKIINLNDSELVRQNNLLTRLLIERETRGVGGATADVTSYLETQSLPGQVAIGTQTDRSAATQTDKRIRSRSDNEESDHDYRLRKHNKWRKCSDDDEPKKNKSLWMRSPLSPEYGRSYMAMKLSAKKVKTESKRGRKQSLSPEVLQEISESLNVMDNSSSQMEEELDEKRCKDNNKSKKNWLDQNKKSLKKKIAEISTSSQEEADNHKVRRGRSKYKVGEDIVKETSSTEVGPSFQVLESESSPTKTIAKIETVHQRKSSMGKHENDHVSDNEKSKNLGSKMKQLKSTLEATLSRVSKDQKLKVPRLSVIDKKSRRPTLTHQRALKSDSEGYESREASETIFTTRSDTGYERKLGEPSRELGSKSPKKMKKRDISPKLANTSPRLKITRDKSPRQIISRDRSPKLTISRDKSPKAIKLLDIKSPKVKTLRDKSPKLVHTRDKSPKVIEDHSKSHDPTNLGHKSLKVAKVLNKSPKAMTAENRKSKSVTRKEKNERVENIKDGGNLKQISKEIQKKKFVVKNLSVKEPDEVLIPRTEISENQDFVEEVVEAKDKKISEEMTEMAEKITGLKEIAFIDEDQSVLEKKDSNNHEQHETENDFGAESQGVVCIIDDEKATMIRLPTNDDEKVPKQNDENDKLDFLDEITSYKIVEYDRLNESESSADYKEHGINENDDEKNDTLSLENVEKMTSNNNDDEIVESERRFSDDFTKEVLDDQKDEKMSESHQNTEDSNSFEEHQIPDSNSKENEIQVLKDDFQKPTKVLKKQMAIASSEIDDSENKSAENEKNTAVPSNMIAEYDSDSSNVSDFSNKTMVNAEAYKASEPKIDKTNVDDEKTTTNSTTIENKGKVEQNDTIKDNDTTKYEQGDDDKRNETKNTNTEDNRVIENTDAKKFMTTRIFRETTEDMEEILTVETIEHLSRQSMTTSSDHQNPSLKKTPKILAKGEDYEKTVTKQKQLLNKSVKEGSLSEKTSPMPMKSSEQPKKSQKPKSNQEEKTSNQPKSFLIPDKQATSRYMSWYKQKREEMERKRQERKEAEEEEMRPRWMRRSRKPKPGSSSKTTEIPKNLKKKIKPLVNVESEQLKAIVRQGRKLRRGHENDPSIQIFVRERPPVVMERHSRYNLVQHSEYKYEKVPPPSYLHPPPPPHPSPELNPESASQEQFHEDDNLDSGIAVSVQSVTKLRHQQLLEKKSVFDIAYSEAAPTKLRSDSSTPPS